MKKFAITLFSTVALAALIATQASAAMQQMLDGKGLLKRVVGNTIHFHAPNEDVYEFLAPDGSIHGESSLHGKYLARWRLFEKDSLCFQHDDPMASGCVAVLLNGTQLEFHRRDGVVEGPFDMLPGNPRML
jgi:hypothetical protein